MAAGFTLAGIVEAAPRAAADQPRDISDIDWEARSTLYGSTYSRVTLDAERLEQVHAGMSTPSLWTSDGAPMWGMPYYFLGKDPATGEYLPEHILVCIDILHVRYEVPDGSQYFDLASLVPEETAVQISRTLNAGLQAARERGLEIATDGSRPLTFTTTEASDIMLAAQITAWQLFARDNLSQPLPYLERGDFSLDKNVPAADGPGVQKIHDYDLSAQYAELDALVERYAAAPGFAGSPLRLDGRSTTLTDPAALRGFTLELDPAASTPGYDAYLDVETSKTGEITLTKKKAVDRPLSLGFRKSFTHGVGGGASLGTGVRAANDQIKTVLSNVHTESFSIETAPDDGEVAVIKSDETGARLDGAEFTLFDSTGTTAAADAWGRPLVGLSGMDGRGELVFGDVPPGTYLLVETRAPDGYARDATPREIRVSAGARSAAADGVPIVNTRLTSDLDITKSNGVSVLQPGGRTTYEIVIANRSDYTQPVDAIVQDQLPEGLTFVSADNGGTYEDATRTVTWSVGHIGSEPVVVSVTAIVDDSVLPGTTISNTAYVSLEGVCPGWDDLAACSATDTDVVPSLELMKTNGTDVGRPGSTTVYELTVGNTSTVDAPDVVITDSLPAELTFISADAGGRYDAGAREVTWRLGTLAPGEQRTVRVTAWVDDELAPDAEIVNAAAVTSAGACADSDAASDEGDDGSGDAPRSNCSVRDVDRVPAVSITKDDGVTEVYAGDRLDYTLVATNHSAVPAPDVVVVDQLPAQTVFVESSVPLADGATAPSLRWSLGELAPGESREIVVSVTVLDDVAPQTSIVNTASVTASGVCADDSATTANECTAEDEDLTVTPWTVVHDDPMSEPDAAPAAVAPTSVAGALARTGESGSSAKIGVLAMVLLITLGTAAIAHKRKPRSS